MSYRKEEQKTVGLLNLGNKFSFSDLYREPFGKSMCFQLFKVYYSLSNFRKIYIAFPN